MKLIKRIIRRLCAEVRVRMPIIQAHNHADDLIVSLTSYPARLETLHLVIRSLLKQSLLPQKIILWLGNDTKESDLPKKLKALTRFSFEIHFVNDNLKPHKKYFYVMQEYSQSAVVTVDDDLIYDANLLRDLYECHKRNPACVCARRVNLMTKTSDGILASYKKWKWECKDVTEPSFSLLATGCGGVLYPASALPKEAFDVIAIKDYCLDTDDIWLKFMELKAGLKVVWTNSKVVHPMTVRHSQKTALYTSNVSERNQNDVNIQRMQEFTGIRLKDFAF